ncbi:FAD/NAD-linked reductase [Forsythia ovata]|uniref:FAD/NAD-linked reductase n=1 Tax=Forsythia ovata TaxID=205694 RepID=A0ABD1TSX4_9LAMI
MKFVVNSETDKVLGASMSGPDALEIVQENEEQLNIFDYTQNFTTYQRTTMTEWHCSSQNTSPSKLSYFFDKPILACVLQGKHIHQSDRLEKCQAPSLSTICHSSLA